MTAHERAQFVEVMLSTAGMLNGPRRKKEHKDLRPAEVKKGEKLWSIKQLTQSRVS